MASISIILPCFNEAKNLEILLPKITAQYPSTELIVVNDGSDDDTEQVCKKYNVTVLSHPYNIGNGAAIKTGARYANGNILVFMDADGQHDPDDIPRLLEQMDNGYEMVVGSRNAHTHSSLGRRIANRIYNAFASFMTGHRIDDLTSGYRAVRARHFRKFLYLLPNGFSYPTTSTMAFFRSGLPVAYLPINAGKRQGESNIRILRDGARFFLIIIRIGVLFSPMRLFLPVSVSLFATGLGLYFYTFTASARLTNMSVLLLLSGLSTFLIGVLSEQMSSLHYIGAREDQRVTKRQNGGSDIPHEGRNETVSK